MGINLNKYTLDDFQILSDIFEELVFSGERKITLTIASDQISWALKKGNKYIKGITAKRERLKEILLTPKLKNNVDKYIKVLNEPLLDLPLLINEVKDPISKAFLTWRLKISK